MNVTAYVAANRDKAFLVGDYASYKTQLSRQLLNLRRRLGRTTPKNSKNYKKESITSQDVEQNHECVCYVFLNVVCPSAC